MLKKESVWPGSKERTCEPQWCEMEYGDASLEYMAYKITHAQSSLCTDREDVGQSILHTASGYTPPAPRASAFHPKPPRDCIPSTASSDDPGIPLSRKTLNRTVPTPYRCSPCSLGLEAMVFVPCSAELGIHEPVLLTHRLKGHFELIVESEVISNGRRCIQKHEWLRCGLWNV